MIIILLWLFLCFLLGFLKNLPQCCLPYIGRSSSQSVPLSTESIKKGLHVDFCISLSRLKLPSSLRPTSRQLFTWTIPAFHLVSVCLERKNTEPRNMIPTWIMFLGSVFASADRHWLPGITQGSHGEQHGGRWVVPAPSPARRASMRVNEQPWPISPLFPYHKHNIEPSLRNAAAAWYERKQCHLGHLRHLPPLTSEVCMHGIWEDCGGIGHTASGTWQVLSQHCPGDLPASALQWASEEG